MTAPIRPAAPLRPGHTVTVTTVCEAAECHPSGLPASYTAGKTREESVWREWLRVHTGHGMLRAEVEP